MIVKLTAAGVAVVLMLAYLVPIVVKLKEISLGVVVALGIGMMIVDLRQSLRKPE